MSGIYLSENTKINEMEITDEFFMVGTNEKEGRHILADAQMATASSLAEAAQKAVELAQAG